MVEDKTADFMAAHINVNLGELFVGEGASGIVRQIKLSSLQILSTITDATNRIEDIDTSEDGQFLIVGGDDQSFRIYKRSSSMYTLITSTNMACGTIMRVHLSTSAHRAYAACAGDLGIYEYDGSTYVQKSLLPSATSGLPQILDMKVSSNDDYIVLTDGLSDIVQVWYYDGTIFTLN